MSWLSYDDLCPLRVVSHCVVEDAGLLPSFALRFVRLSQDGEGSFAIKTPLSPTSFSRHGPDSGQMYGAAGSVQAKAYWVSYLDGLQRVLLFTDNPTIRAKAAQVSTICMQG